MRRLALFPLPIVLFPGAVLPLHIFESRYRQMVAHALEADKRFGLVYHDAARHGQFRMEDRIGCVARIRQFQPLPDGRSLLVTEGMERFRVEDGIESASLYEEGLVEEYADRTEAADAVWALRHEAARMFGSVLHRDGSAADGKVPSIDLTRETAFQIARWIRTEPRWQQQLLERRSEEERLRQLNLLLQLIPSDEN